MIRVEAWTEWAIFAGTVLATMVLDRLLCSRGAKSGGFREALKRSLLWVVVGAGFSLWVMYDRGLAKGTEYLTAYLLEKSLSVDNLFVFLVIFRHFGVNDQQQRRALFWGVFGAVVLRAVFIVLGTELLLRFHWTFYLFGAFLVVSGVRLVRGSGESIDPSKSLALRFAKRWL